MLNYFYARKINADTEVWLAISSPYNLGKPLLIMNNDTTTLENSLPFIGTDKIEEIPKVISERNNLNQVIL